LSNNASDIFSSSKAKYASRPNFYGSRNTRNEFNKNKKNEYSEQRNHRAVDIKVINDDEAISENIKSLQNTTNKVKTLESIQSNNESKTEIFITSIDANNPQNNSSLPSKKSIPTKIRTISEGIGLIATLGGHQGRKHDPLPGPEIIGKGMHVFNPIVQGISYILELLKSYDKSVPIGTILEGLRLEEIEIIPLLSG
jgi:hypothetical protein